MSVRDQRNSRRKSVRIQQSTIGTHVVSNSRHASRTNVNFSSSRVTSKAHRGEIRQVMPRTSTRESVSSYSQRSKHRAFAEQEVHRTRLRAIVIAVVVVIVAVAAAGGAAWFAYSSSVNGRMMLSDSAVSSALVAPSNSTDPYYVLVSGDYSDSRQTYDGPGLLLVVRVDPVNKVVTTLDVPTNIELMLSDGKYHKISEEQTIGGDAGMISTVSNVVGVSIAHYVKTDATSFVKLVDTLGGVTVDVSQEVDDPDAGDIYLQPGTQTLNGQQALTLVRADNYTGSVVTRAKNQEMVFEALVRKMMGQTRLGFAQKLDSISSCFKTDMSLDQLTALLQPFGSGSDCTIYTTRIPGSTYVDLDGTYFNISNSAFSNLMSVLDAGGDPNGKSVQAAIDPSQVTVTVKNGAGITGAATQVTNALTGMGFKVPTSGNADSYVYNETLVIYKDSSKKAAAETIVDQLGVGRTVDASINYSFDTDLQVIIGKDWKPLT